jgi:hypothetical protein
MSVFRGGVPARALRPIPCGGFYASVKDRVGLVARPRPALRVTLDRIRGC